MTLALAPETQRIARALRIASLGMLSEAGLAQHRRKRLGQSRVFFEHRAYTRGDDVRSLDWRAFARTGRPMLKRFEDEGQLQLLIGIDTAPSLQFGQGHEKKCWPLYQLAQALTDAALAQEDAVGLWWLGPTGEAMTPQAHRKVSQQMATALARGPLATSARDVSHAPLWPLRNRRPHRVVLMGDWLDDWVDGSARLVKLLTNLRARGHVTHVVRVIHPLEASFPFEGAQPFVQSAEETSLRWTQAEAVRPAYLQAFRAFGAQWRAVCRAQQATAIEVTSGQSLVKPLREVATGHQV